MAPVIVLWVCLSIAGVLALLRAASRRLDSSVPPEAPKPQTYTSAAAVKEPSPAAQPGRTPHAILAFCRIILRLG